MKTTDLALILKRTVFASICLGVAFAFSNCASVKKPTTTAARYGHYDVVAKRPSNPANVRVAVSLSTQTVYVKEGDQLLMATAACVGTAKDPTPRGTFRITRKEAGKRRISQPGAGYPMPNWCEIKSAYGFHGGWVHPYPASHGCIRLPWKVSSKFFNLVRVGTPVSIAHTQPEDATIASKVQRLDDRPAPEWPAAFLGSRAIFDHCGPGALQ